MSMEHNFTLALFNLDKFFSNAPANVPEELKHDWVKVHGLVYHKDNVVIVAQQERDQQKELVADLIAVRDQLKHQTDEQANKIHTLTTERDDVRKQIQDAIAALKQNANGGSKPVDVIALLQGIPSDA